MARLVGSLSKWLNKVLPSQIHDDPAYQAAHKFKDTFSPKEGADYNWIADYARLIYDRLDQADRILDAKAEGIIKLLGGGTGLLSLGAILNVSKLGLPVAIGLGVSLLLALVAIAIAAWVRVPRQTFLPPSVGWALAYADFYGDNARDRFLAQWHLACEGVRLAVRAKARGVRVATWWAATAILALTLSFVIAICTMDIVADDQASGGARMSQDSQANTPPAPDPAGSQQTPEPATAAEPQHVDRVAVSPQTQPAQQAEPQSLQFGRDGSQRR